MSVSAMKWAFDQKGVTSTEKLVLLALADHADDAGRCWPSVARMEEMTALSERSIRKAIQTLEEKGALSTDRGVGRGNSSKYILKLDSSVDASTPQKVQDSHLLPDTGKGAPRAEKVHVVPEKVQNLHEKVHHVHPNHQEPSRTVKEPPVIPRAPRGTRLPADWQPSSADRDFARSNGINPDKVAPSFRDYWHGRADKGAVKLDWSATWRNWCRRDAERNPQNRSTDQQSAPPKFKNPFLARQYAEMQRQQDQDDDNPHQPLRLI